MERGPPPPPHHYLPAGSHHLSVHVMGTSLMARLLRSTVGSLNSSSDTELETSNFGVRLWGERWGVGGTGGNPLSFVTRLPHSLWGDSLGWDPSEPHGLAAPLLMG